MSVKNGYIEESNGNKYLTLVPTYQRIDTLKKYENLWNKIRDLIRPITNNSDNYDEKYNSNLKWQFTSKKTFERLVLKTTSC